MSSASTPPPPPPIAPGAAFNMREMRESLALAEKLAKASMAGKGRSVASQLQPIDANNNNEEPRTPAYVPPKQLLLYLVR